METRDLSNNSRIARRFVLYDDTSDITVGTEDRLYFTTAMAETGYKWQTTSDGGSINIMNNKEIHLYIFLNIFYAINVDCVVILLNSIMIMTYCIKKSTLETGFKITLPCKY